jgi:RNA polymerase sigma factor (sigma-70 family)
MDDSELLQLTSEGNAEAFAVFYRRHLPRVLRFCLRSSGSREIAADVASEVFAVALAGCGSYEDRVGSAAPWLLGIARNKLADSVRRGVVEDSMRRRLGMRPVALHDADLDRVEELVSLAGSAGPLGLVAGLPEGERVAVRARVLEERPYAAIAAELHCSEAVVRQRVSRGLRTLRSLMGEG